MQLFIKIILGLSTLTGLVLVTIGHQSRTIFVLISLFSGLYANHKRIVGKSEK